MIPVIKPAVAKFLFSSLSFLTPTPRTMATMPAARPAIAP